MILIVFIVVCGWLNFVVEVLLYGDYVFVSSLLVWFRKGDYYYV